MLVFGKKIGQVSLFLVVVIVVAVSVFGILFLNQGKDSLYGFEDDGLGFYKSAFEDYMLSCLKDSVKEAPHIVSFDEGMMESYVEREVELCIEEGRGLSEERGFMIDSPDVWGVGIETDSSAIIASMHYPVVLSGKDSTMKTKDMVYRLNKNEDFFVSTNEGISVMDQKIISQDGMLVLNIPEGITLIDKYGVGLESIGIELRDGSDIQGLVSDVIYDFQPGGAVFSGEGLEVLISYENIIRDRGIDENDLVIGRLIPGTDKYDVLDTVIDREQKVAKAHLHHFSEIVLFVVSDDTMDGEIEVSEPVLFESGHLGVVGVGNNCKIELDNSDNPHLIYPFVDYDDNDHELRYVNNFDDPDDGYEIATINFNMMYLPFFYDIDNNEPYVTYARKLIGNTVGGVVNVAFKEEGSWSRFPYYDDCSVGVECENYVGGDLYFSLGYDLEYRDSSKDCSNVDDICIGKMPDDTWCWEGRYVYDCLGCGGHHYVMDCGDGNCQDGKCVDVDNLVGQWHYETCSRYDLNSGKMGADYTDFGDESDVEVNDESWNPDKWCDCCFRCNELGVGVCSDSSFECGNCQMRFEWHDHELFCDETWVDSIDSYSADVEDGLIYITYWVNEEFHYLEFDSRDQSIVVDEIVEIVEDGWLCRYNSIEVLEGVPYFVCYNTDEEIGFGYKSDNEWHFEQIPDTSYIAYGLDFVVDKNGVPHLSFLYTNDQISHLCYAEKTSEDWFIYDTVLDGRGYQTRMDIDNSDNPHILYTLQYPNNLVYLYRQDDSWYDMMIADEMGINMDIAVSQTSRDVVSHIAYRETDGEVDEIAYVTVTHNYEDPDIDEVCGECTLGVGCDSCEFLEEDYRCNKVCNSDGEGCYTEWKRFMEPSCVEEREGWTSECGVGEEAGRKFLCSKTYYDRDRIDDGYTWVEITEGELGEECIDIDESGCDGDCDCCYGLVCRDNTCSYPTDDCGVCNVDSGSNGNCFGCTSGDYVYECLSTSAGVENDGFSFVPYGMPLCIPERKGWRKQCCNGQDDCWYNYCCPADDDVDGINDGYMWNGADCSEELDCLVIGSECDDHGKCCQGYCNADGLCDLGCVSKDSLGEECIWGEGAVSWCEDGICDCDLGDCCYNPADDYNHCDCDSECPFGMMCVDNACEGELIVGDPLYDGEIVISQCVDTHINKWDSNSNFEDSDRLSVRSHDVINALIKHYPLDLPSGAEINSAELHLWLKGGSNAWNTWIGTFRIERYFSFDYATWLEYNDGHFWEVEGAKGVSDIDPDYSDSKMVMCDPSYSAVECTTSVGTEYVWDVTDIVQDWADGEPNFGILLKYTGGTISNRKDFYPCNEEVFVSRRPKLVIDYTAEAFEICDNGIDDDSDSYVDCEDDDCVGRKGPDGEYCRPCGDSDESLDYPLGDNYYETGWIGYKDTDGLYRGNLKYDECSDSLSLTEWTCDGVISYSCLNDDMVCIDGKCQTCSADFEGSDPECDGALIGEVGGCDNQICNRDCQCDYCGNGVLDEGEVCDTELYVDEIDGKCQVVDSIYDADLITYACFVECDGAKMIESTPCWGCSGNGGYFMPTNPLCDISCGAHELCHDKQVGDTCGTDGHCDDDCNCIT